MKIKPSFRNGGGYIRLKTFAGSPNDGSYPNAVIADGATVYGTPVYGGIRHNILWLAAENSCQRFGCHGTEEI
jgi:hypothetical protein